MYLYAYLKANESSVPSEEFDQIKFQTLKNTCSFLKNNFYSFTFFKDDFITDYITLGTLLTKIPDLDDAFFKPFRFVRSLNLLNNDGSLAIYRICSECRTESIVDGLNDTICDCNKGYAKNIFVLKGYKFDKQNILDMYKGNWDFLKEHEFLEYLKLYISKAMENEKVVIANTSNMLFNPYSDTDNLKELDKNIKVYSTNKDEDAFKKFKDNGYNSDLPETTKIILLK
ncbi:MAG: hypothetical protein WC783_04345 [Candidatus Paceibacterota bacterium]